VRLDRACRHHQPLGDLEIGPATRHRDQHLPFAVRQRRDQPGRGRVEWRREVVQQPAGGRRGDHRVAGVHGAYRGQQLLRRRVLEQEAAGAGPDRGQCVFVQVERGQDDDLRRVLEGEHAAGGLDAVEHRHTHVHQHEIRAQPPDMVTLEPRPGGGHALSARIPMS
jgi:hypothetical protein